MKGTINKKGLSVKYIVMLIILVLSFAVILLFYYMFDWFGEIDKQACRESVVIKSSMFKPGDLEIVDVPLKCKTEKICISKSKNGNCDDDFVGEEYVTEKVEGNTEEFIKKTIAEKLSDCWWMMGEGSFQIYGREFNLNKINKKCNFCARIAFDDNLNIDRINGFTSYLVTHPDDSDKTYWQYITNSESNYIYGYERDKDFLTTDEKVIVFAEMSSSALYEWLGVGGSTAAGAIAGAYIGSAVPIIGTAFGGGIGGLIGFFTGEAGKESVNEIFDRGAYYQGVKIIDYDLEDLRKQGCTSFEGRI